MSAPDFVVLGLLFAFALWGALRGPLRQLLSLALLAIAFFVAGWADARLQDLVGRITGLEPAGAEALAWALTFFVVLTGGAILISIVREGIARVAVGGTPGRITGALLGGVHGALWAVVIGYTVLAWPAGDAGPSLQREDARAAPTSPSTDWRERTQTSFAGRWLVEGGRLLRQAAPLPPWVEGAMQAVDEQVRREP